MPLLSFDCLARRPLSCVKAQKPVLMRNRFPCMIYGSGFTRAQEKEIRVLTFKEGVISGLNIILLTLGAWAAVIHAS